MAGLLTTVLVYAVITAAVWIARKKTINNQRLFKRAVWIMLAANTLAAGLFLLNITGEKVSSIAREKRGESKITERLRLEVAGVMKDRPVDIEISGQAYTKEEEEQYVRDCKKKLTDAVTGKDQSADHVTCDLKLPEKLPDNPTRIQWRQDDYSIVAPDGKININEVQKEGSPVLLTASLSCGATTDELEIPVMVYPKELSSVTGYMEEIERLLHQADLDDPASKSVALPEEVDGKKIIWKKESGNEGFLLIILGAVAAGFMYAQQKEKIRQLQKKREREMAEDHPKILNLFSMLLRAGLTPGHIWKLIVEDYERQKKESGARPAFEAMAAALRKMTTGMSQEEVYLDFGHACGDMRYEKFGQLLARNLRRGSSGLADQLAGEARAAFQEQKLTARRRGEEAQTKLLLPMLMLLLIVLVVVMVPAFLSMQM